MMERWLPLALFGIFMAVVMALIARSQSRKYQEYLAQHAATNDKLRESQDKLIQQQERSVALAERTAVAAERIAAALEQHKP